VRRFWIASAAFAKLRTPRNDGPCEAQHPTAKVFEFPRKKRNAIAAQPIHLPPREAIIEE
jgi:hypothetical protein